MEIYGIEVVSIEATSCLYRYAIEVSPSINRGGGSSYPRLFEIALKWAIWRFLKDC